MYGLFLLCYRLARRESDFFTKTWGESFEKYGVAPAKDLPVITKADFQKYLKKTSRVSPCCLLTNYMQNVNGVTTEF